MVLLLADHDFKEEDLLFEPEKIGFFKRLIGKEKSVREEYIQTLQKRIFPNEPNKLVTLDDILDNQIQSVNKSCLQVTRNAGFASGNSGNNFCGIQDAI